MCILSVTFKDASHLFVEMYEPYIQIHLLIFSFMNTLDFILPLIFLSRQFNNFVVHEDGEDGEALQSKFCC